MQRHQELVAWQVANQSAIRSHVWIDANWRPARASTFEQLRRASLSVPLNVVEGFASGRGARCRYHLRIAFTSAVETSAILEFLAQLGDDTQALLEAAIRTRQLTYKRWAKTPA